MTLPESAHLLSTHNLLNVRATSISLQFNLSSPSLLPPNALPDIHDDYIKVNVQRIVGSILCLALCSRPDIAYTAMALSQSNANPTRTHLLAVKGALQYLVGTMDYGLEYNPHSPHRK